MARIALLAGKQLGRLSVIRDSGFRIKGHVYWLTKCSCGREKLVRSASLLHGVTTSCGCLGAQRLKEFAGSARTHGAMARNASPGVRVRLQLVGKTCSHDAATQTIPRLKITAGEASRFASDGRGATVSRIFSPTWESGPKDSSLDRRKVNRGYSKSKLQMGHR
jgi:hypothetical protein